MREELSEDMKKLISKLKKYNPGLEREIFEKEGITMEELALKILNIRDEILSSEKEKCKQPEVMNEITKLKENESKIEKMRHEVIELSIMLENYLDGEISSFFGFEEHKASYYPKLEKERDLFKELFLRGTLSRKIEVMGKIISFMGEKLYKGFWKDEERFRSIRNEFAHTFAPERIEKGALSWDIKKIKIHHEDWTKKYDEFEKLFYKIIGELDDKIYLKNPRRRKYRNFDEDEKQWLIKRYEDMFKDKGKA